MLCTYYFKTLQSVILNCVHFSSYSKLKLEQEYVGEMINRVQPQSIRVIIQGRFYGWLLLLQATCKLQLATCSTVLVAKLQQRNIWGNEMNNWCMSNEHLIKGIVEDCYTTNHLLCRFNGQAALEEQLRKWSKIGWSVAGNDFHWNVDENNVF